MATDDVEAALTTQRLRGRRLGEILVAMGRLRDEDLHAALDAVPNAPLSLPEIGLGLPDLLDLLAEAMQMGTVDTAARAADELRLPPRLAQQLMDEAKECKLVEVLGQTGGDPAPLRPERGREGLAAEGNRVPMRPSASSNASPTRSARMAVGAKRGEAPRPVPGGFSRDRSLC